MGPYEQACRRIAQAKTPVDLFGPLAGTTPEERADALRKAFHELVRLVHPDRHNGDQASIRSFERLMELHAAAEGMLKQPSDSEAPVTTIKTSQAIYEMHDLLAAGDICDVYRGLRIGEKRAKDQIVLKILRENAEADLFADGTRTLKALWAESGGEAMHFHKYLPTLVASLEAKQPDDSVRQVQVLSYDPAFIPLTDVLASFPEGLDPRDAAWMGNRIFEILAWIHSKGIVHGAILPTHILIRPEDHAAQLIGWSASLRSGETPKVISPGFEADYAPEVFQRACATPAIDVYMAAQLLTHLMGSHPLPKRLAGFLKACRLHQPAARFPDGRAACLEFKETLKAIYGPPTFRPFSMPNHVV